VRIVFWGTPEFAVPSLRALDDEGFEIVGIVTQPDRPAGRGRRLRPSPVRQVAEALEIPILTPERPRGEAFMRELGALRPDLSVVVAYGHILLPEVLELPPMGSINVHASLLPELRGAAPVNWAIARGHSLTGVTVMRMVEAMDAGPILLVIKEPILSGETAAELSVRLSELGAEALVEALTLLAAGSLEEVPQDDAQATFAPKVDRGTARVDWSRTAQELEWHIRGMDEVPGAWSELEGEPVKLFRPTLEPDREEAAAPGTVVQADGAGGLVVATGEGVLRIGEVQPSGRRRIDAHQWIHGRGVRLGQRFI
jgi:methionyl-tRNA formyltransferase